MKMTISLVLVLFSAGAYAQSGAEGGPCKDKREAKHAAHQAVHQCLTAWAKDARPTDVDPTDDCSGKMSSFVSAAKDLKACRVSAKENKAKK